MRRPLLVLLAAVVLAACAGPESTPSDPSPGAMADAPPPEALDAHLPPDQAHTRADFRAAMAFAARERLADRPIGEAMVALGETFIGRPYIIGPLDGFGREVLVARLDSFDCFTYVEALLAMARGVQAGDTTFAGYLRRTEQLRYRDGRIGQYPDRLHYFTDWIDTNARRGIVRDVTAEAGGEPFPKRYGFMSAHREAYPALAEDDGAFARIGRIEDRLNAEVELFFIPQGRIAEAYPHLLPGDILSTATDIEGLDVTHTGLAYPNPDGTFGLLHASTSGGVKVSPDLQAYVQGVTRQIGLLVARPVDEQR